MLTRAVLAHDLYDLPVKTTLLALTPKAVVQAKYVFGTDLPLSTPAALSGPVQLLPELQYPAWRLLIIGVGLALAALGASGPAERHGRFDVEEWAAPGSAKGSPAALGCVVSAPDRS